MKPPIILVIAFGLLIASLACFGVHVHHQFSVRCEARHGHTYRHGYARLCLDHDGKVIET